MVVFRNVILDNGSSSSSDIGGKKIDYEEFVCNFSFSEVEIGWFWV